MYSVVYKRETEKKTLTIFFLLLIMHIRISVHSCGCSWINKISLKISSVKTYSLVLEINNLLKEKKKIDKKNVETIIRAR